MPKEMRGGVTIDQYLEKMDLAGIERSLLIAVRAGDIRVPESFEIPYSRVYEICQEHPARFSGLAGIDPFRGMAGLKDLEEAVKEMLAHEGAYFLEVMVGKENNVFPMIPTGASVSEIRLS